MPDQAAPQPVLHAVQVLECSFIQAYLPFSGPAHRA
jgi:hypothetical protein